MTVFQRLNSCKNVRIEELIMKLSKLIVVLGMHRSGTSAITRGLQVMGAHVGDRLLPPEPGNPKGFWEDIDITSMNVEMLHAIKSDWHHLAPIRGFDVELLHKNGYYLRAVDLLRQKIGNAPVYAFKDPRVAKLLPFWKGVFDYCQFNVHYVVAVRHPLSVVNSLAKRDGFTAEKSFHLWLDHVLTSLLHTVGEKRVCIDYDHLMQSPEHELQRIAQCFGLKIDSEKLKNYTSDFLEQGLRHSVYDLNDLTLYDVCPPLVREIYTALLDVVKDKNSADDSIYQTTISEWSTEFNRNRSLMTFVDRLCVERDREVAGLNVAIANCNEMISDRDHQIADLNEKIVNRDYQIASLNERIANRDGQIKRLNDVIGNRDGQIANLNGQIAILTYNQQDQELKINRMHLAITQNKFIKFGCSLDRLSYRRLSEYLKLRREIRVQPLFDAVWYLAQYPDVIRSNLSPLYHYYYLGSAEGRNPNPYFDTLWYLNEYSDVSSSGMNPLLHYLRHGVAEGRNPSPYFDTLWYLNENSDVARSGMNPLLHFSVYGAKEGRTPNAFFDAQGYLDEYQDVARSGMNPFLHFIHYGAREGRNPSLYFDTRWYVNEYPDVIKSGVPAFFHYMKFGAKEGRNPNPFFDTNWYLSEYPDVADTCMNAFLHFLRYGAKDGKNPSPYFNVNYYLNEYPDVAKSGMNPLLHFLKQGLSEGKNPNPYFDTKWYLKHNPDVEQSGMNPLFHYMRYGGAEGRDPSPYFNVSWYLNEYPDVARSGIEPLLHHLNNGEKQWRETSPAALQQRTTLQIVPHYIDSKLEVQQTVYRSWKSTVAIHLHLDCSEMLNKFIYRLKALFSPYDLFVSISDCCDLDEISALIKSELPEAGKVIVESVPNRGQDIAPLIVQFGNRLVQYDIFAHFHAKKNVQGDSQADWGVETLDELLGNHETGQGRAAYIINLLQNGAKVVYSEGHNQSLRDRSGWSKSYELARGLLEKYLNLCIDKFPVIDFPEYSMFWARTECLKDFLQLPIHYDDFQEEPAPIDGTLAHALKKSLLIFSWKHKGRITRLHKGDSISDYRYYEQQRDYSESIIHNDIKVLSFYLPQFRAIPENDLWHGEGFTEWTKVKSANPLFKGHYQQHIPHPDIGYYLLDSPVVLKKQAEQMRQSGVYGQVFYHYWFSGKLILESAARILLDNADIEMPFCFCWANENWTRRWDGNENEILLGQNYSADDALAFIQYLIPFFRDTRYIKIDNRPVLFIYRPVSIPNVREYIDTWEKECNINGISAPYIVAVLTRGASDPQEFGMDAGVERVLHDWTGGAVPDIKSKMHAYYRNPVSVLSYDDVADFYSGQIESKPFTYFRSLVPNWDNTARYGEDAFLLHNSTPEKFQKWLEKTVGYTKKNLPEDRRFVLINAWNEWAEGAHLEPDSLFGYSYLNSIGRVLSEISYEAELNPVCPIPEGLRIFLNFSEPVLTQIQSNDDLKYRFLFSLSRSSIFKLCPVKSNRPELLRDNFPKIEFDLDGADYCLDFNQVCFFDPTVIEKMVMTACSYKESVVVANSYGQQIPLTEVTVSGSVGSFVAYDAPLVLSPKYSIVKGIGRNFKMRTDAQCFVACPSMRDSEILPEVTTIIRFHKSGNMNELQNALYCLQAMQDCIVIPFIAAQDLTQRQIDALDAILCNIKWSCGNPRIVHYATPGGDGDLRSKMLVDSLRSVTTRYAAFLDYDDLLMPHAYGWLIGRLHKSKKAVSFGRVYCTIYDGERGIFVDRKRTFERGSSYSEFLDCNHAPIHSFMLDLSQFKNLDSLVFFEDQKYMEDYLLTLQLFTELNADWSGLSKNVYIGDYVHSLHRSHTLAFLNDQTRDAVLTDINYLKAENRINDMKKVVVSKMLN